MYVFLLCYQKSTFPRHFIPAIEFFWQPKSSHTKNHKQIARGISEAIGIHIYTSSFIPLYKVVISATLLPKLLLQLSKYQNFFL